MSTTKILYVLLIAINIFYQPLVESINTNTEPENSRLNNDVSKTNPEEVRNQFHKVVQNGFNEVTIHKKLKDNQKVRLNVTNLVRAAEKVGKKRTRRAVDAIFESDQSLRNAVITFIFETIANLQASLNEEKQNIDLGVQKSQDYLTRTNFDLGNFNLQSPLLIVGTILKAIIKVIKNLMDSLLHRLQSLFANIKIIVFLIVTVIVFI